MSNQKKNKQKDKQNKPLLIVIIALLLVLAVAAGVILFNILNKKEEPEEEKKNEHKGVVGEVVDGWDPGVEKPSGEKKQGTQIPGYSSAEMSAGDTALHMSIGNPKENKVGMFATLKLSDGTVLYESGLLKPGQGLTEIPLEQTLEKGVYDAMVVYQCVLLDDENTPLNAAESGFKLYVN